MVSRLRNPYLWVTVFISVVTVVLSFATYIRWLQLSDFVGPFRFHHWTGWIGTLFVAVYIPLYHILKRRYPQNSRTILGTHVIGNMLSFLLISIHFWGQLGRPAQFYPDLGTGIVLYIVMVLLVWTGFSERFQILPKLGRKWKFLHINMATAFYLVILVHILHGLGLL